MDEFGLRDRMEGMGVANGGVENGLWESRKASLAVAAVESIAMLTKPLATCQSVRARRCL